MVLRFFGAFFAGYNYESASQQRDPKEWALPADGRRSHCMISFEITLPSIISVVSEVRYDDIMKKQPVPFPHGRQFWVPVQTARVGGTRRRPAHYAGDENHLAVAARSPFQWRSSSATYELSRLDLTRALRPQQPYAVGRAARARLHCGLFRGVRYQHIPRLTLLRRRLRWCRSCAGTRFASGRRRRV